MVLRKVFASRSGRVSVLRLGVAFIVVALLAGVALFQKNKILTTLEPGETITVEFTAAHQLREYVSDAKIAGVPIGVVTSVARTESGVTEVKAKVDEDDLGKLGSAPSAKIRPTTMLGGNYYLDLKPGGQDGSFDGRIPVDRTSLPVELGDVASAIQPDARKGIRSSIRDLDDTLASGGSKQLKELARRAPGTLGPAAGVFDAMRGTQPRTDLPRLVRGLEATSRTLAAQRGQLDAIVGNLATTSDILDRRASDMATATAGMPETLRAAKSGLRKLDGTLTKLGDTAGPARPSVRELGRTLDRLDPVLAEARPVVNDMREVLAQARPLVDDLTPASRKLKTSFDNLDGPVLDRVNGPIMETFTTPWHGTGRYAGSGSDRPMYQVLAHLAATADRATTVDKNGSTINFHAGYGPGSVAGLPISLEQMFRHLAGQQEGR
ncbi:MAG: MCE family protein [Actinophytocola sp.]|nr:MCE family protein [Actinophytocola sp.]